MRFRSALGVGLICCFLLPSIVFAAAPGCGQGVIINEFSDAEGTGNFIFEFVELHYDK